MVRINRDDLNLIVSGLRVGFLIGIAIIIVAIATSVILHGQPAEAEPLALANEHRFTALETKMDNVQVELDAIILGLATLLGERGVSLFKSKTKL